MPEEAFMEDWPTKSTVTLSGARKRVATSATQGGSVAEKSSVWHPARPGGASAAGAAAPEARKVQKEKFRRWKLGKETFGDIMIRVIG